MELRIDFDFEAATEYLDEVKDSVLDRVILSKLSPKVVSWRILVLASGIMYEK